jgi:hypothetical protein
MKNIILLIIALSISTNLFAVVLEKIVITGNDKTTFDSIISHGQIHLHSELTDNELQEIKERLLRINQIHLKSLKYLNATLFIDLEEKWTLYPVPIFTNSGSYKNQGLLLYDDNFLGTLGTFVTGISKANSKLNGLIYFQNETLFTSNLGLKVLSMRTSDFVEFSRSKNIIRTYDSTTDVIMITPNILYKDHVLKAGPLYQSRKFFENSSQSSTTIITEGLFLRHHWNNFEALDILYNGIITTYDFYLLNNPGHHFVARNEGDIAITIPVASNYFNFGIHGHWINNDTFNFAKLLGGAEGYRGYDKSSFPAVSNLGLLVQYQQHLFDKVFFSPFYEFNRSKLIRDVLLGKTLNEHTLGVGLRYYFSKISIPAIVFDYARNINDQTIHLLVSIGVSF